MNKIFDILREVIPNELEDYFDITDDKIVSQFIEDIITDIKDNLE